MGLKRQNCIAWVDITDPARPEQEYQDHIIEARLKLDSKGGYAATGIIFRIMDEGSYYIALISSKGYFRLDVVKDSAPRTLIAWTEFSGFDGENISLNIVTHGTSLVFIVNGKWLGEVNDNTVTSGRLGFALASYTEGNEPINNEEESKNEIESEGETESGEYICRAMLCYFSVDTRIKQIEEFFNKCTNDSNINAEGRLRLAETFAVMGESLKALEQINRAWKRRDEVIREVASSEVRTKRELLLAARMSFNLGHYDEANEYINSILDQWQDSQEGKFAYTEKIKILNELNKFEELRTFMNNNPFKITKDIDYYTIAARCHWELKNYLDSAEAWNMAFDLNKNGIYAVNAANAYEYAGKKKQAITRYIEAGKIFLNEDNMPELAVVMQKLAVIGTKNWEARALAGKWAFSIEDYNKCAIEFEASHKIRSALKPRPKADPAVYYLWGLTYYINGKNKTAINMLKKAVKLAPDYELFSTKLEELMAAVGDQAADSADD